MQEGVALDDAAIERHRAVADLEKRHGRVARSDAHEVAFGAVEEKFGRAENGIRPTAGVNLFRDARRGVWLGQKLDLQLRGRGLALRARCIAAILRTPAGPTIPSPPVALRPVAARTIPAGARPTRAITGWPIRTRPAAISTGRASAASRTRPARPAVIAIPAGTISRVARVVGVRILGRAFFQPVGQKLEIKLLGQIAHRRRFYWCSQVDASADFATEISAARKPELVVAKVSDTPLNHAP
jgi:hypothetical protein